MYGSNQRGGGGEGSGGIRVFWTLPCPPSKNLLGPSYKILNISAESSAQAQSIGNLFELIGFQRGGGGSVDMSKSQRHTRSGAGRGVSQANEAAIYPKLTGLCQHEIVSGTLKKWKQSGTVQASYRCLVDHVCMGGRVSQFLPHNSATLQFQVLMSKQMDAYLEKEQIVHFLSGWGHRKAGLGGVGFRGV